MPIYNLKYYLMMALIEKTSQNLTSKPSSQLQSCENLNTERQEILLAIQFAIDMKIKLAATVLVIMVLIHMFYRASRRPLWSRVMGLHNLDNDSRGVVIVL
jgi:hypothetical protein